MLPQALEIIELPCFRDHDMYQHITVIKKNPLCVLFSLHSDRFMSGFSQLPNDSVHDRFHMAVGRARNNYHVIGDVCQIPNIENTDIQSLCVTYRFNNRLKYVAGIQLCLTSRTIVKIMLTDVI